MASLHLSPHPQHTHPPANTQGVFQLCHGKLESRFSLWLKVFVASNLWDYIGRALNLIRKRRISSNLQPQTKLSGNYGCYSSMTLFNRIGKKGKKTDLICTQLYMTCMGIQGLNCRHNCLEIDHMDIHLQNHYISFCTNSSSMYLL